MKLLERAYYSQRNNIHNPSGTCFPTALACMISPFVNGSLYQGKQLEDMLWEIANEGAGRAFAETLPYARYLHGDSPNKFDFFSNKCLNTVWDVQKFVGNYAQNTMRLNWKENGTFDEIKNHIDANSPIIIQINRTNSYPIEHIICIIGYDNTENTFFVMDSWGNAILDYAINTVPISVPRDVFENQIINRIGDLTEVDFILGAYVENNEGMKLNEELSQDEIGTIKQIINKIVINGNTVKYPFEWLMKRLAGNPARMMWGEYV